MPPLSRMPVMSSHALDIHNLSLSHSQTQVLDNLHLTLPTGAIGCLLGPSGCGKTSLLRCVAGFETPSHGQISIAGTPVAGQGLMLPPEQRGIGMVFQDYALFPHLSVADNIAFGLHRLPRPQAQNRTREWIARLHLEGLSERLPHQLSGGQQQRVALARALAPQPSLLLMDEPFANLDAALREKLSLEVRDLLKSLGTSALLVTHDPQEAFTLADSIGVMRKGHIVQWDTPYRIYHQPTDPFVADFVGLGSFIQGEQISCRHIQSPFGTLTGYTPDSHCPKVSCPTPHAVNILIRPDDIVHDPDSQLKAQVIYRAFRGPDTLYRLQLADGQQVAALFPSHIQLQVGDTTPIRMDTGGHVVTFPLSA